MTHPTPFQQHAAAEISRHRPGLARLVDTTKLPAEPTVHGLPTRVWRAAGAEWMPSRPGNGDVTVTPALANGDRS